jgi:uncharacterized protein YceK
MWKAWRGRSMFPLQAMKFLFLLLILSVGMMLSGCASLMSKEDQDFYGRGWLNPKQLDDVDR